MKFQNLVSNCLCSHDYE